MPQSLRQFPSKSLKKIIQVLKEELSRSQKELEKVNRDWERRFNVLRASLHEIKDESFLRRKIEHQPLAMHTSSFPAHSDSFRLNSKNISDAVSPVLPPLKPGVVRKLTPSTQRVVNSFSPTLSENFSSGSESEGETDLAESEGDEEYPPLKLQLRDRSITR